MSEDEKKRLDKLESQMMQVLDAVTAMRVRLDLAVLPGEGAHCKLQDVRCESLEGWAQEQDRERKDVIKRVQVLESLKERGHGVWLGISFIAGGVVTAVMLLIRVGVIGG